MVTIKGRKRFDLSQKTALVTGGCSGIGHAIALGLADYGARVVLADIAPEKTGRRAVSEIESQTRSKGCYIRTDITRRARVQAMVAETLSHFHRLDILVNSAAVVQRARPEETAPEKIRIQVDVNLIGLFYCCQEAGKVMLKNKHGSIINISSTDADAGVPNVAVYAATKGGVNALTRALAVEWAPSGVRVNAISPCVVETDMVKPVLENKGRRRMIEANLPLGISRPADFQGPAVFLAADASSMVTGHILHVDGGYLAK